MSTPADVEAALLDPRLAPPPAPPSLTPGPTADLRDAMARFSGAATHPPRRATVEQLIEAITDRPLAAAAERRTTGILAGAESGAVVEGLSRIGFVVPVEVMADALGMVDHGSTAVLDEVATVVEVIGRGRPSSPESDTAAEGLLVRAEAAGHDPEAAVSLLYQTHDATAALFASTVVADHCGLRRCPALSATSRTAASRTNVGQVTVDQGAIVSIDLAGSGFEFGLGPHACPGQELAHRLVAGMTEGIARAGFGLDSEAMTPRPDGRPATLPLVHIDGSTPT